MVYSVGFLLFPRDIRGGCCLKSPFSADPSKLSHAHNQSPAEWPGPTRSKHNMAVSALGPIDKSGCSRKILDCLPSVLPFQRNIVLFLRRVNCKTQSRNSNVPVSLQWGSQATMVMRHNWRVFHPHCNNDQVAEAVLPWS